MMFIGKYLRTAVFLCVFYRYQQNLYSPTIEFLFAMLCLCYIVFLPPHLFFLLRKISLFEETETPKIVPTSQITHITPHNNKVTPISGENFDETFPIGNRGKSEIESSKMKCSINQDLYSLGTTNLKEENEKKRNKIIDWEQLKNLKEENEKTRNQIISWEALKNIQDENDLTFENQKMSSIIPPHLDREAISFLNEPTSALRTTHSAIIHKNQLMVGDDISQIGLSENAAIQKNNIWKKCFNMIMMPIKYILNFFFQAFIWIYQPKDEREFSFRYSVLVKDLKKNKTIAKFYFFIELIRYLLLSLIVSQFYANPLAQVCLLEVVCLFFLIFLIAIRPMKIEMCLCFLMNAW